MKLKNFKMYSLMLATSALFALSGCDGTTGIISDSGIGTETPAPVTQVPDAGTSTVTASPASVAADGTATSTVTVTVTDASSTPITNASVTLAQTGSSMISAVTNVGDGTYTFDVNSTTVETVTYTAAANGITITQTADVDFILPANITIDNASLQKAIGSIVDTTPYPIDVQGVIDAGGLTVTVPYTVVNNPVTLPAYSKTFTIDSTHTEDDETGIIATFAWAEQTNLPVGAGTFTATITIDDSNASIPDNTYNAKKLDIQDDIGGVVAATFPYPTDNAGGTGILTLTIYPGIPDRMFGTVDNNRDANTHMLLYLPVTNTNTGKTWLNNNLGANYSNINSPVFDLAQQATKSDDPNAYGSLFQWGRKADGHELITWIDGLAGTLTGTTSTLSDDPVDTLFIYNTTPSDDWRINQDDNLWTSESSGNNVCPVGYRVPTIAELNEERLDWNSNDATGALTSPLALSMSGYRNFPNGSLLFPSTNGYYWGSSISGTEATFLTIHTSGAYTDIDPRASGMSVRCIKN